MKLTQRHVNIGLILYMTFGVALVAYLTTTGYGT